MQINKKIFIFLKYGGHNNENNFFNKYSKHDNVSFMQFLGGIKCSVPR